MSNSDKPMWQKVDDLITAMSEAGEKIGDKRQEAEKYLDGLRSSWKDTSDTLSRLTITILLLAAIFEIATRSPTAKFTLAGVEVPNSSLILKLLPVVVAYLFFDHRLLTLKWVQIQRASDRIVHRLNPALDETGLNSLLTPRLPPLWNLDVPVLPDRVPIARRLLEIGGVTIMLVTSALPIAFLIYSYYRLSRLTNEDAIFWVSLFLSTILTLMAFGNTARAFIQE